MSGATPWVVPVLVLIAIGLLWAFLRPTGRDSSRPAGPGDRNSDPGAGPTTSVPDEERLILDDRAGQPAVPWYLDPARVAWVRKQWDSVLQEAAAEVFIWRNDPEKTRSRADWLAGSLQHFQREDGRRYRDVDASSFQGLVGDLATAAHRGLEFQRSAWLEWWGPAEGKLQPLATLPRRAMAERPLEFPVEMHTFDFLGTTELPDDPELDRLLNECRNRAIRTAAELEGQVFIYQNAMSRCIRLPEIDRPREFPGSREFGQIIPAYRELEEERARIAQAYRDEIRFLLQAHGYLPREG